MHDPVAEKAQLGDLRLIRLVPGEDLLEQVHKRITEVGWFRAAVVSCIGSLKGISFRNPEADAKLPITPEKTGLTKVDGPCEILSIQGNIFPMESETIVHLHGVVGQPDGTTRGGHILKAKVFTTCEMFIARIDAAKAIRKKSETTGLDELYVPEGSL